jgi:hypothetical protein
MKGNSHKILAKLDETMAKSKSTSFRSGVDKVVKFLDADDW